MSRVQRKLLEGYTFEDLRTIDKAYRSGKTKILPNIYFEIPRQRYRVEIWYAYKERYRVACSTLEEAIQAYNEYVKENYY